MNNSTGFQRIELNGFAKRHWQTGYYPFAYGWCLGLCWGLGLYQLFTGLGINTPLQCVVWTIWFMKVSMSHLDLMWSGVMFGVVIS